MRKLMSKKGFTLVELMIVVVILGILVAVAVPIFGAVTKNARIKSCKSNQRVIKGNMETFMMTGGANNGEAITLGAGTSSDIKTEGSFLALFDGGALPKCPSADAAGTYQALVTVETNKTTYTSSCTDTTGIAEGHNG